MKKRPAAALSILLCALMLLLLAGCGGDNIALENPAPAEFESVMKMRFYEDYNNCFVATSYLDGYLYCYDENDWEAETGTTMVIDLQTGERRELGLRYPIEAGDGWELETSRVHPIYWYDSGSWYVVLHDRNLSINETLFRFSEETGELTQCPIPDNQFSYFRSLLVAGNTLYSLVADNGLALYEIDLESFEVKERMRAERYSELRLLDCSEDALYVLEKRLKASYALPGRTLGLDDFRILAIDRNTGGITDVSGSVPATSVTLSYGGSLYFVGKDETVLSKADLVTGEVCPVGKLDEKMTVAQNVVGGLVFVETEEGSRLFSLKSGEFLDPWYSGFEVTGLAQQMPEHVVFLIGKGRQTRLMIADREDFEQGRLDRDNVIEVMKLYE